MTRLNTSDMAGRGGSPGPIGRWLDVLAERPERSPSKTTDWRILLVPDDDGFEVLTRKGPNGVSVGRIADDVGKGKIKQLRKTISRAAKTADQLVLRMPSNQVVQKNVQLPAGTRHVLEPVIRNQIEMLTPWPIEEAVYGFHITRELKDTDQIEVRVTVAGKDDVQNLVTKAERYQINPGVVDFANQNIDDASDVLWRRVPKVDTRIRQRRRVGKTVGVVSSVCALAAIVGLAQLYFVYRDYADVQSSLEIARRAAKAIGPLAKQNERLALQNARVAKRKREVPPRILLLDELTKAVPDTAWLDALEIKDNKLRVLGKARNAAELIRPLEDNPHFADVQFSAATTREPETGLETFTVSASVISSPGLRP